MTGAREAKTTTVPLGTKRDPVYQDIDRRLRKLDPPIILENWLTRVIKVHSTTLGGVDFEPKDADRLIACLEKVKGDIYKVTVKHTCNVYPDPNCFWGGEWSVSGSVTGKNVRLDVEGRKTEKEKSVTLTISGKHDVGGGDTGKRRR